MPSNHISQIVIIESLSNQEAKTGKILFEYIEGLIAHNNLPISVQFENSVNSTNFFSILGCILQDVKSKFEYPLIHIECHGSDDGTGIVLANDDYISWLDLKLILTEINIASESNLMVVLGACYGAHLTEIIQITDRAPCWAILGPAESVMPDDLISSYRLFYKELLSTLNWDVALSLLFSSSSRKADYWFVTAQGFFKKAYSRYLSENCSQSAYWSRAKGINAKLTEEGRKYQSLQPLVYWFRNTEKEYFEKYRDKFFMVDLYPENSQRFNVDYEEIKAE